MLATLVVSVEAAAQQSLWVGERKTVIEVVGPAGRHRLEIPVQHLEDIAVDQTRGVVWVGTRQDVIQYTLEGQERSSRRSRVPSSSRPSSR
ncbi:MAG TPA: hypothetical protein VF406_00045 [Thermodesulfobacteriota bacterium]